MQKDVSEAEISNTIFTMKSNKAPGPYNFSIEFYKAAWSVVGDEVVQAVKLVFATGKLLKEVNATIFSLVPKKQSAPAIGDFRPISCCNEIYKCSTKIYADRLLPGLSDLISQNQVAFITGRSIAENIMLTQEVVKNSHRGDGKPRCTIKVDLMKAYDSVSWEFILLCLLCVGAPTRYVDRVRECITSPKSSIALNGSLVGILRVSRG